MVTSSSSSILVYPIQVSHQCEMKFHDVQHGIMPFISLYVWFTFRDLTFQWQQLKVLNASVKGYSISIVTETTKRYMSQRISSAERIGQDSESSRSPNVLGMKNSTRFSTQCSIFTC